MKQKVAVLLTLLIVFVLVANGQAQDALSRFKIIGYYPLKSALTADAATVPLDKLTHVNLWFVNPDSAGHFTQDYSGLIAFIEAAHAHGVKVLLSLGEEVSKLSITVFYRIIKEDSW